MAEITKELFTQKVNDNTLTMGEAIQFAKKTKTELDPKADSSNIQRLFNNIKANKVPDISLDDLYFDTVQSDKYIKGVTGVSAKSNYYTLAQDVEKFVNSALISARLPEKRTQVIGVSGVAKDLLGEKAGQTRGELPMRGLVPSAEIDKIYLKAFENMGDDVDFDTKAFLFYHRYTSHRLSTILDDTKQQAAKGYKSLRLSDILITTDPEDNKLMVQMGGSERGNKSRFPATFKGPMASFLKDLVERAKTNNPNKNPEDIKLFNTDTKTVSKAFEKYVEPQFMDKFQAALPFDTRNNKVASGISTIMRSANIKVLTDELKISEKNGDAYMSHKDPKLKAKAYAGRTVDPKIIGNTINSYLEHSAFNLKTGSIESLFTKFGLSDNLPSFNFDSKKTFFPSPNKPLRFTEPSVKLSEQVVGPDQVREQKQYTEENIQLSRERTEESKLRTEDKEQKRLEKELANLKEKDAKFEEIEAVKKQIREKKAQAKLADQKKIEAEKKANRLKLLKEMKNQAKKQADNGIRIFGKTLKSLFFPVGYYLGAKALSGDYTGALEKNRQVLDTGVKDYGDFLRKAGVEVSDAISKTSVGQQFKLVLGRDIEKEEVAAGIEAGAKFLDPGVELVAKYGPQAMKETFGATTVGKAELTGTEKPMTQNFMKTQEDTALEKSFRDTMAGQLDDEKDIQEQMNIRRMGEGFRGEAERKSQLTLDEQMQLLNQGRQ